MDTSIGFPGYIVRIYETDPETGAPPAWEGMIRADGSHPPAGTADIVRAAQGRGVFRGRYLRLVVGQQGPALAAARRGGSL